jgi:hypothetical protein
MYTRDKKPKGFKPYSVVNIEGNSIIDGGGVLIEAGDKIALLVGRGSTPKVWAYNLTRIDGNIVLEPVVENSISKNDEFVVSVSKGVFELTKVSPVIDTRLNEEDTFGYVHPNHGVSGGDVKILRIEEEGDNTANILALDYRPLGADVRLIPNGISVFGLNMRNFHIVSDDNAVLCSV